MRYFVIVDDSILENFRVDNYKDDQKIMVVLDETLSTRGFLLRPLPDRKEDLHYPCNEYVQAVNEGWNACLDKIIEEEE